MHRRTLVRYLFIAITLWCVAVAVKLKLIIYKPTLEKKDKVSLTVNGVSPIKSEANFEAVKARNAHRLRALRRSCKSLGYLGDYSHNISKSKSKNMRAHISPDLNVLYCRVNKCGSTFTLEVMKRVFNCDAECLLDIAKNLKNSKELTRVLKNIFSFLIVREPYGRLFASYGNLFYLPKEDWLSTGVKIIRQVRKNPSRESLKFGHDLTFFELIKYVVHNFENGSYIDPHVRPMHHASCNPCSYRFDFLAKIETLTSDLEYLLHDWHSKHIIDIYSSTLIAEVKNWTTWGPLKHFYKTIYLTAKSGIPVYKLYLRTWTYYQMKGMLSKKIDMPFRETEIRDIHFKIFRRTLAKAIKLSETDLDDVRRQRLEAMKQAYATVPTEYMERLVRVVRDDCILFGYNERPDFLFNRSTQDYTHFDYLKGLQSYADEPY